MSKHDDFDRFKAMNGGWHGPGMPLPDPPKPDSDLKFFARLRWHVCEYFRSKTDLERLAIRLARLRKM